MKLDRQFRWIATAGLVLLVALASPILLSKPSQSEIPTETAALQAPVLSNLGSYTFPISTTNEQAQRYFNQGMILAYGFNHAEAFRSLQAATKLDVNCAMCYWGMAYVLGPNINAAMEAADVPTAYAEIQQAIALKSHATQREQAYIEALAQRYSANPVEDRTGLDLSYAEAMSDLSERYPDDPEAATLYAEALMDTMPWDYWRENGTAKPETTVVLNKLKSVIERYPDHPAALHFYIHAVEKEHPELGIEVADRLRDLVPAAGHLVHMPSHIYIRVGRYHDAVVANLKAIAADESYATQCHAQGLYPVGYMPHNHHFLWFSAVMAGQRDIAMEAAHHTAMMADKTLMREPGYGTLQHYASIPLYTLVKFEQWDEVLAQPAPDADLAYPTAVWHYARGMAFANKQQIQAAAQELETLEEIVESPALEGVTIWDINTTRDLLQIARAVLSGEISVQQGDMDRAIASLRRGVALEDALNYDEPSPWYSPVRQKLGTVLLQANRSDEAEATFRADLEIYPNNGWSLYGLTQALTAQGKTEAAQQSQSEFEIVWQYADVEAS